MTFVQQFVADLNFDLFILTDYFDEGLILMKRKLCWNLKDILYVRHRSSSRDINAHEKKKIVKKEEEMREIYKEWSKADYIFYNEANKTFWKEFSKHSDIQEEINHYKEVKKKVQSFCHRNLFMHLNIGKDLKKLYTRVQHSAEALIVDKSYWNSEFKVDLLFCLLLHMNDNVYRFTMK